MPNITGSTITPSKLTRLAWPPPPPARPVEASCPSAARSEFDSVPQVLSLQLLGTFRVLGPDGQSLAEALPRRCAGLLAYVVLKRPAKVYRDRAAAVLYPDLADAEARARLRRNIYLIAQLIPEARRDGWFLLDTNTVAWNPAIPIDVDVERVRTAHRAGAWKAAVDAYGGDLLGDVDDEWVHDERERLREQYFDHLERLAQERFAAGEHAASIAAAQELLRLEPWREAAIRILMQARFVAGDRAGALAEYERFSRRLRDDLDVEPMPETSGAYAALLARTARSGKSTQAAAPPRWPASGTLEVPFAGRLAELASLRRLWERATEKNGGLALVSGESGVGKTRLIAELAQLATAGGGLVLHGGTTFVETHPYQAVVEALRSSVPALARHPGPAPWRASLQSILPELRGLEGTPAARLSAEAERRRLFESAATALESLAAERPVLLVLEDLHWAAAATIALLGYLARRLRGVAVAIVVSYREDDLAAAHPLRDLRRQLVREENVMPVPLAPLALAEVEQLLSARFGAASREHAARYHAATDGMPLFLVELLTGIDGAGRLAQSSLELPQSVATMMESRLSVFSGSARTALEVAAIVGSGFDEEVIAAATGWSDAETLENLSGLLSKHVVRESTGPDCGALRFTHEYYREYAYRRIPVARRRQRHARVARAMEDLYPERSSELAPQLAEHHLRAGQAQRAIPYLLTCARTACAVYANEEAATFSARALQLGPADRIELELLLVREEAFRRLGRRDAQRADLQRAERIAEDLADDEARCEVIERAVALLHATGDRQGERREIERGESLAGKASGRRQRAFALARGRHLLHVSDYAAARTTLEVTARACEAGGEWRGAFESYVMLGELARIADCPGDTERWLERAERQLAALDDARQFIAQLYEVRASDALSRQRYLEADRWARHFLAAAEATGDIEGLARAHRQIGSAAAWRLDVAGAREHLGAAAQIFERLEDRYNAYVVSVEFALLAVWLGRLDEAIRRFEHAAAVARTLDFEFGVAANFVNLAHALIQRGDYAAAVATARKALDIAEKLSADAVRGAALVNLGAALRELGDFSDARVALVEACALAEASGREDLAAEACAQLSLTLASLGSCPAALDMAERARRILAAMPPALQSGERYWIIARALHLAGAPCKAAEVLHAGSDVVAAQLASIPDAESRLSFRSLPAHFAILSQTSRDAVIGGQAAYA